MYGRQGGPLPQRHLQHRLHRSIRQARTYLGRRGGRRGSGNKIAQRILAGVQVEGCEGGWASLLHSKRSAVHTYAAGAQEKCSSSWFGPGEILAAQVQSHVHDDAFGGWCGSSYSAGVVVLADLLEEPGRELISWIQERFPGRDVQFYGPVVNGTRAIIDEFINGLQKANRNEPSPTLVDRLSFSWRLMKRADVQVRKGKKSDTPALCRLEHAETKFQSILSVQLQKPLLTGLVRGLRLGENAEYLYHYVAFRWAKEPTKLPNPFGNIGHNRNIDLLRTLIWWCIRSRSEEYVEVRPNEPVHIEFGYVVGQVLQDLKGWCGPEIEQIASLTSEIEDELNRWLRYSRLDLAEQVGGDGIDPDLARAFVRHNELTTKLARIPRLGLSEGDQRVAHLESQLRQYAEENRSLEERLRAFEDTSRIEVTQPTDVDTALSAFAELREVLKIVDTKYAFDTLNSVQIGEETVSSSVELGTKFLLQRSSSALASI